MSATEVSRLCHDLRQCLSAGMLLSAMPDNDRLDPETRRRFELIAQTMRHARDLLASADELSAGPAMTETDLLEVAQASVAVATFAHKVRFVTEADHPPIIQGDALLVRRAIDNLVDNAGRAAGEAGDVVVRVADSVADVWVEVVDDGPGFGEIEHGTGRGLSVVSATTRACGGRLEIASGPGPGTSVRLVFPRVTGAVTGGVVSER